MEQRLQYELLIGEKLEGLSIPNMEDMIWARIKAQLDIDMPTDDNDGGDNGPKSPLTRGPLSRALSIAIIALITAFLFFKNKPATIESTPALPSITQPANEPSNQPTGPPAAGIETPVTAPAMQQVTPTAARKSIDTSSLQPALNGPLTTAIDEVSKDQPDSVFTKAESPPLKVDTLPTKKKGKGVSGLKDDDYRIVPKKNE